MAETNNISDSMIEASAIALSESLDEGERADGLLYPRLNRYISPHISPVSSDCRLSLCIQHSPNQHLCCPSCHPPSTERGAKHLYLSLSISDIHVLHRVLIAMSAFERCQTTSSVATSIASNTGLDILTIWNPAQGRQAYMPARSMSLLCIPSDYRRSSRRPL